MEYNPLKNLWVHGDFQKVIGGKNKAPLYRKMSANKHRRISRVKWFRQGQSKTVEPEGEWLLVNSIFTPCQGTSHTVPTTKGKMYLCSGVKSGHHLSQESQVGITGRGTIITVQPALCPPWSCVLGPFVPKTSHLTPVKGLDLLLDHRKYKNRHAIWTPSRGNEQANPEWGTVQRLACTVQEWKGWEAGSRLKEK